MRSLDSVVSSLDRTGTAIQGDQRADVRFCKVRPVQNKTACLRVRPKVMGSQPEPLADELLGEAFAEGRKLPRSKSSASPRAQIAFTAQLKHILQGRHNLLVSF